MKIYLAIPYSGIEKISFEIANKIAGILMSEGHIVYSPISHSHSIAEVCDLPKDWAFWEKTDTSFIEWCDNLCVVHIHGLVESSKQLISKSKGVTAEIAIAKKLGKGISEYHYTK